MIESDQCDKESQDEMSPLEVSNNSVDTNEFRQKRLQKETSEEEEYDLPAKKLCTSVDETVSKKHNSENISELNGDAEERTDDVKENIKDISTDNKKDKVQSVLEETTNEIAKESHVTSEIKNNEGPINKDATITRKNELDIKQEENMPMESVTDVNIKDVTLKEEIKEEKEDNIQPKRERRKSQVEAAEVVEGLELSVECASDKESSTSSENEDEKNKIHVPKTIIVKAKPNDSELDISSSEADKSDSQNAFEEKLKQTVKKGRKRGRKSFSKTKNTDSEENNDDVSDEDYSPKTKKKFKKTMTNKKSSKLLTESKRGHVKAKKEVEKSLKKGDEEDENSNITEDIKKEENSADVESIKSKTEDESDSEDTSTDSKGRKSTKSEMTADKRIQLLKKYIRITGIRVKSYNDLWAGCKSDFARIKCLKQLLKSNGVTGRPSIEKCQKARERNESLKDVAELNTSNIISEGRVTRARRNRDSNKELTKTPETSPKHREARKSFKRVLNVVDSDSE